MMFVLMRLVGGEWKVASQSPHEEHAYEWEEMIDYGDIAPGDPEMPHTHWKVVMFE